MSAKATALSGKLWDGGSFERHQHEDDIVLDETMAAGVRRARVTTVLVLERYHRRGQLDRDGERNDLFYTAGLRLRRDFEAAGLRPRVTAAYQPTTKATGGADAMSVEQLDAYTAWVKAIRAIGPIASNEVMDACCLDQPVGEGVRMEILRRGLMVLAAHYGLCRLPTI